MSNQPLVSIGLPTYNRASTLRRAMDSVLTQDYRNLELVISDNASTDETEHLCLNAAKQDNRIRYFRQQTNQGALANFRDVLTQARGEFFMWLADDDWLDLGYLSRCMNVLAIEAQHSLVCGSGRYYQHGVFVFDEDGLNLPQECGADRVLSYYQTVRRNGAFYGLMRRELISKLPLGNMFGGDLLLTARVAFLGKVLVLSDVHLNRSIEGASQDLTELAVNAGLRGFMARYPHVKIAISVFKDILWKSPVYRTLHVPQRFSLALKSALAICRYSIEVWRIMLLGAGGFRTTVRQRLSKILDKTLKTHNS